MGMYRLIAAHLAQTFGRYSFLLVALAAMALSRRSFYPPFEATEAGGMLEPACGPVLVTSFGHWCGEALGLVEPVAEGGRG